MKTITIPLLKIAISALLLQSANAFSEEYYTGKIRKELTIKECGKEKNLADIELKLNDDNTWNLRYQSDVLYGPYIENPNRIAHGNYERRKQRIIFSLSKIDTDIASYASLLITDISSLCDRNRLAINSDDIKQFHLVSNKRGSKIDFVLSRTGTTTFLTDNTVLPFRHRLKGTLKGPTEPLSRPAECGPEEDCL